MNHVPFVSWTLHVVLVKVNREKNSLYLNSPRTQRKELDCFQEKFIKKKETKTYSKKPTLT